MHHLHQNKSEEASKEAERRIDDDFGNLTKVLQLYVEDHKVLPYCMILHSLAYRYLGGGLLDPTYKDEELPYRSSPQITMMLWNLGNWCRNRFEKCPVPESFQQFIPHSTTLLMKNMKSLMRTRHSSTITLKNALFQKASNNSFHASTTLLMKNMKSLMRTRHSSTFMDTMQITSSTSSRTLEDIFS